MLWGAVTNPWKTSGMWFLAGLALFRLLCNAAFGIAAVTRGGDDLQPWGVAILTLPLAAAAVSGLHVLVLACCCCHRPSSIQGDSSIAPAKFLALAGTLYVALHGALVEAALQLVLQGAALIGGIPTNRDFSSIFPPSLPTTPEVQETPIDWPWYGYVVAAAPIVNFASLVAGCASYDGETSSTSSPSRFFAALATTASASGFRSFIFAVLCSSAFGGGDGSPVGSQGWRAAGFVALAVVFCSNLVVQQVFRAFIRDASEDRGGPGSFADSLVQAWGAVFAPFGHGKDHRDGARRAGGLAGSSEAERAVINLRALYKNALASHALHWTANLALMAAYAALLETGKVPYPSVRTSGGDSPVLPETTAFLYVPPCVGILLGAAFSGWYLERLRALRDGAQTWCHPAAGPPGGGLRAGQSGGGPDDGSGDGGSSTIIRFHNVPSAPMEAVQPFPLPMHPPCYPGIAGGFVPPYDSSLPAASFVVPQPPAGTPRALATTGTFRQHPDDCVTCDLMKEGSGFSSKTTGKTYIFSTPSSCTDKNLVYLVTCSKPGCGKQYVGKTEQELRQRHYGHRREIETGSSQLGKHFSEGCGYTSLTLQVIDRIQDQMLDGVTLKKELQRREGYWQHELMTFAPWGLNTRDELGGDSNKT